MISSEALLILLSAFATGRLLQMKFLSPFIQPIGNTLIIYVLGFAAFFIFVYLEQRSKTYDRLKFLTVVIFSLVIIGTVVSREASFRTKPPPFARNDGATQSIAAADFLLHGKNPYASDFTQTIYGSFFRGQPAGIDYGALTHYAYPPLVPLLNIPAVWADQALHIRVDAQSLYVIVFLLLVVVLLRSTKNWSQRTKIAVLTLANPFVWMYPVAGWNDIIFITAVVCTAIAIEKRNLAVAGFSFGLALAAKQTSWLLIPLWAAWLSWLSQQGKISRAQLKRAVWSAIGTAAVLYLPFVLWNAPAMYDDIVRYVSGSIPNTYPIQGITFLQYLYKWHLIASPWVRTPTYLFQLLAGVPALWLALRMIKKHLAASAWLFGSAVFILAVTLFGRFGAENYYATVFLIALDGYCLQHNEHVSTQR